MEQMKIEDMENGFKVSHSGGCLEIHVTEYKGNWWIFTEVYSGKDEGRMTSAMFGDEAEARRTLRRIRRKTDSEVDTLNKVGDLMGAVIMLS